MKKLLQIDRFVPPQHHGKVRGPVRHVCVWPDQGLVLEVAFEGLAPFGRGIIVRRDAVFAHQPPRWDKPPLRSATAWKRWRRC